MPRNSLNTANRHLESVHALPEMALVENKLHHVLTGDYDVLTQMGLHLLSAGGKRIRPLLAICTGRALGPLTPKLINTAAAMELIHMASLVHDDIIDHSSTRRGKPSLNALWGNQPSVLAGDFLFARAFGLLATSGLNSCLKLAVDTIEQMCQGEIEQAVKGFKLDITEDEYLERITKKTAVLLSASCQAGAMIAKANKETVLALGEYGRYLGLTYQIIDDLLDLTGQPAQLGKPTGQDLQLGNITLPLIILLSNGQQAPLLEEALANRNYNKIIEVIHNSGALEQAQKKAAAFAIMAKSSLTCLTPSPYKDLLLALPDLAMNRIN
ncbi:MAG: polyprenyl synthetase family protein [Clostridia bacterium]|nr:polyprenyl synthetase family protein [Clostridia bacterium]